MVLILGVQVVLIYLWVVRIFIRVVKKFTGPCHNIKVAFMYPNSLEIDKILFCSFQFYEM